jgi:glycogen operon protein
MSWNCGIEGPTDDSSIERLRNRQVKNFFAVTLLAAGAPMLLMGDEVRRSQQGNNNAYGQDNEISWFDWDLVGKHAGVLRFVKHIIRDRQRRDVSREDTGLTLNQLLGQAKIAWHGVKLNRPDWGADSHVIAMTMRSLRGRLMLHMMVNAYWEELEFEIPPVPESSDTGWMRWVDTFRESPDDICSWDEADVVREAVYPVQSRSVVILAARLKEHGKS